MSANYQFELNHWLKCEVCGNKPAVDLTDPYTGERPWVTLSEAEGGL